MFKECGAFGRGCGGVPVEMYVQVRQGGRQAVKGEFQPKEGCEAWVLQTCLAMFHSLCVVSEDG